MKVLDIQSCLTLFNPMDCSSPDFSELLFPSPGGTMPKLDVTDDCFILQLLPLTLPLPTTPFLQKIDTQPYRNKGGILLLGNQILRIILTAKQTKFSCLVMLDPCNLMDYLLQCTKVKSESKVTQSCRTLPTPWTAAYQAAPSMGFSRQEYWSGSPFSSPKPTKI